VHLSSLPDDFYVFDQARGQLVGRRTRRVIKLGDKLNVQVFKVDSFKKQVDFQLVPDAAQRVRPAQDFKKRTQSAPAPVKTPQPPRQTARPPAFPPRGGFPTASSVRGQFIRSGSAPSPASPGPRQNAKPAPSQPSRPARQGGRRGSSPGRYSRRER